GVLLIVLFVVFELLYVPCIIAIARHLQHASFKLMLYVGVTDMLCLCVCGLATGLYAIEGAVLCSHPTQIYWLGVAGESLWLAESSTELLLSFNRCVDTLFPRAAEVMLTGGRPGYG